MLSKEIKILLIGSNLWYFGEGMLGPLFAIFGERIGGNVLDISWAWAVYLLVTGVLVILIGRVSDAKKRRRFFFFYDLTTDKKRLLIIGYALNALFTFSYLLVRSPLHLFFVQAGLGVAAALATPTWEALYSLYGEREQKGYEWGLVSGQAQILTAIGLVIGGLIVNYFSFQILFIVMGMIQVIATVYQARIFKEVK